MAPKNIKTPLSTSFAWLCGYIATLCNGLKAVAEGVDAKQDKLTFDTTPTENSTNPVTSGGVYAALANTGGGSGVVAYRHAFTAADWSNGTITIPAATHGITGADVLAQFSVLSGGAYVKGSWASATSYATIDAATHVITLISSEDYAGAVLLVG